MLRGNQMKMGIYCYEVGNKMRLDLSDLRTLALFNKKVDKLWKSSFVDQVFHNETGFMIYADKKGTSEIKVSKIEVKAPTQEAIDACVLTFRLFIQDNDKISISIPRILAIYAKLSKEDQNQAMMRTLYKEHKAYRRNTSDPKIIQNGKALTKWEILRTFIYGDLSHMDDIERPKYMEWTKNEINEVVMRNEFIMALAHELSFLLDLQQLNDLVIIEEMSHFDVPRQFSLIDKAKIRMLHTVKTM